MRDTKDRRGRDPKHTAVLHMSPQAICCPVSVGKRPNSREFEVWLVQLDSTLEQSNAAAFQERCNQSPLIDLSSDHEAVTSYSETSPFLILDPPDCVIE